MPWRSPISMTTRSTRRSFFQAANEMETTFNLFYIDSKNIAMFSTGRLPIRARGVDPSLPTLGTGRYDWRGFLGEISTRTRSIEVRGGSSTGTSKPARGWGASDSHWSEGSVHRVRASSASSGRETRSLMSCR